MTPWRVAADKRLLERRWLTLREQHVVLPNGVAIEEFHLIGAPDWVAVVALTDDGEVLLVDQYRHGIGGVSRELPAGVIDDGETALQAAERELREETGYAAASWQPLLTVATEPSRHTNRAHFFFATGARRVAEPSGDASENIAVCLLPPRELIQGIDRGELLHGVHVGAILLAARRGWLPGL
jgi:8-oxo-dGTP pyrophosphatase MutT (NUDIX family)